MSSLLGSRTLAGEKKFAGPNETPRGMLPIMLPSDYSKLCFKYIFFQIWYKASSFKVRVLVETIDPNALFVRLPLKMWKADLNLLRNVMQGKIVNRFVLCSI